MGPSSPDHLSLVLTLCISRAREGVQPSRQSLGQGCLVLALCGPVGEGAGFWVGFSFHQHGNESVRGGPS